MTLQQEFEVVHGIAQKLAHALGCGWTYQRPDELGHAAKITHEHGAILYVTQNTYLQAEKGKVKISTGLQYEHVPHGERAPAIQVSLSRGIDALAKEIRRRLLPAYLPLLERTQARAKEDKERRAKQAALLDELATLGHAERRNGSIHWYVSDGFYGDGSVSYDETVSLKLERLPLEVARQIVTLLGSVNV